MDGFSEKILQLINLLIYRIPELPGSAPLPSRCDRVKFCSHATAFSPARSSPFVCECVSSVVVANFGSPTRDQFANGLNDPTDPDFLPGPTAFNSRRGDDIASLSPTAIILRRKTAGGSREVSAVQRGYGIPRTGGVPSPRAVSAAITEGAKKDHSVFWWLPDCRQKTTICQALTH